MIRLSPAIYNRQLALMGQSMLWRRAALCPCRDAYSGGAFPGCPVCGGRGLTWGAGTVAKAGVVGAKSARKQADFSKWEEGDVALSVAAASPLWDAGENDRVAMLDSTVPFQVRKINTAPVRLDFTPVTMTRCFWVRGTEASYREADLPTWSAATGLLTWGAGEVAPDAGDQFTLVGTKMPEFVLYQHIVIGRGHFGGLPLPKLLHCKLFDLWGK